MTSLLRSLEAPASIQQWGIAVLRLVVGFTFFLHGWQKLVDLGIPGVTEGFAQTGIPYAALTAPLVAYLELVGGAALMVGLFTRWISVPLAFNMLAAMTLVHWSGGFFAPTGIELPLILFAALATLALGGPGALALDYLLARPTPRESTDAMEPRATPAALSPGTDDAAAPVRRRPAA